MGIRFFSRYQHSPFSIFCCHPSFENQMEWNESYFRSVGGSHTRWYNNTPRSDILCSTVLVHPTGIVPIMQQQPSKFERFTGNVYNFNLNRVAYAGSTEERILCTVSDGKRKRIANTLRNPGSFPKICSELLFGDDKYRPTSDFFFKEEMAVSAISSSFIIRWEWKFSSDILH